MTRTPTRTNFNSSSLLRVLIDLDIAEATEPGADFAEKLGHWVSFTDAIALSAVHSAPAQLNSAPQADRSSPLRTQLDTARARLASAITQRSGNAGKVHTQLPTPQADLTGSVAGAFEPYRRYYQAHQRELETQLSPLRTRARDTLAQASPALQQLAALDAILESILSERESRLLAKVPTLLQRRFAHLLQTHQPATDEGATPQDAELAARHRAWQTLFGQELQAVLLAELDLRLQPTLGLIEAYEHALEPLL